MGFNYGDIFDAVLGESTSPLPAITEAGSGRSRTWKELQARSNRIARALLDADAKPGDKIALYMDNRIEYIEILIGLLKARLVHVNVNFRYQADELYYVLDNSDATVLVFDAERAPLVEAIRSRLDKVKVFVAVGEVAPAFPQAMVFEASIANASPAPLNLERSGDDLWMLYTGGTTGMPKAVVMKQDVLFRGQGMNSTYLVYERAPADMAEHMARVREHQAQDRCSLVCAPLMHAVGLYTAIFGLSYGVAIVLMPGPHFDAEATLDAIEKYRVSRTTIVGDAIASPLVQALKKFPNRWDLSRFERITSSGMVMGLENKRELIRLLPQLVILDGLGSSESPSMAFATATRDNIAGDDVKMALPANCKVFAADLSREVEPGSGEKGLFARSGLLAEGYYKDPEATAKTFRVIDGVRYVVPGDWAEILADGCVKFLGRGALCINSGGEKVYVEEVEAAVKRHPSVYDAAVVPVPDARWGQAVTAVVELHPGASFDAEAIKARVRELLAGYKVPKHVIQVPRVAHLASGKTDYGANREFALNRLGDGT